MAAFRNEIVTDVQRWTDRLFSFKTTRNPSFRFENGQFTMLGLTINGKPLVRAYSIVSTKYDDHLEFLSIIVPDGALTATLSKIDVGDSVLVGPKPTGTLLLHNLAEGRNLYLLATGTGLAPFLSLVRDPETYEKFERIVLVHGCRHASELAYREYLTEVLPRDEHVGELARAQLIYYPTVTREAFQNQGRITDLITSGKLFEDIGLPPLSLEDDRVMLCGSTAMLADTKAILDARGFKEGNHNEPGHYVIEKAFVG